VLLSVSMVEAFLVLDMVTVFRANALHWLRAGADDDGAFGRRYSFLGASSGNTVTCYVRHGVSG
jgi:hypothetical protein